MKGRKCMATCEIPLKDLIIEILDKSPEARELVVKTYKEWVKSQEDSKKAEVNKIEKSIAKLNKKYNTNYYLGNYNWTTITTPLTSPYRISSNDITCTPYKDYKDYTITTCTPLQNYATTTSTSSINIKTASASDTTDPKAESKH